MNDDVKGFLKALVWVLVGAAVYMVVVVPAFIWLARGASWLWGLEL